MTDHKDDSVDEEKDTPVEKKHPTPPPAAMPTGTGNTLPPTHRFVPIVGHTIVDVCAIGAVAWFVAMGKLDTMVALGIIGAIAGVWVTGTGLAGNLVKAVKKKTKK